MANESANGPCVKCYLAFALIIVVVLVATGVWNPFPNMWDWANQSKSLSRPGPAWQQRLGGTPQSVTIAGDAVIIERRTTVEARSLSTGVQLWERKADWAAVAGDHQDPVVAVGKLLVNGYEVLDPRSGAVRRRDDLAVAVWTYRNALLDASCFAPDDCTLTAWPPRGSTPLWTVDLPGIATTFFADNPEVLGTRRLTTSKVAQDAGGPESLPALIGFSIDSRIYVVDTANGRLVQEVRPERRERVVPVGGRVLHIRSLPKDGTCYFTVEARDPANGQRVWQQAGLNLGTADRGGCMQRHDPEGGLNVLVGTTPDLRDAVVSAYDGRRLLVGEPGEEVVSVDDRYAIVRAADKRSVSLHALGTPGARWTRSVDPDSAALLTQYAAVVTEQKPDRIVAVDLLTGQELANVRSSAKVLAVGPGGMIIGEGREIAYIRFGGSTGAENGAGPDGGSAPGGDGPGGDRRGDDRPDHGEDAGPGEGVPTCGGPKNEQCVPPGRDKGDKGG